MIDIMDIITMANSLTSGMLHPLEECCRFSCFSAVSLRDWRPDQPACNALMFEVEHHSRCIQALASGRHQQEEVQAVHPHPVSRPSQARKLSWGSER